MRRQDLFTRIANFATRQSGHPWVFTGACLVIIAWAVSGAFFHFSDTWQLVINTGTTIVTFLMVFLIQNAQTRDSEAIHLKLDELIRSNREAHNALLDMEELNERDLEKIREQYKNLANRAREDLRSGKKDQGIPEVELK